MPPLPRGISSLVDCRTRVDVRSDIVRKLSIAYVSVVCILLSLLLDGELPPLFEAELILDERGGTTSTEPTRFEEAKFDEANCW